MESGLHIAGHGDDQTVDLVVAEPKGRVLGFYRGVDGEIFLTVAEARFLLDALPAMVARADYLEYMGELPALDPSEGSDTWAQDIEVDRAPDRTHQIGEIEEVARARAINPAQTNGQSTASSARSVATPHARSRSCSTHGQRSGRSRAGQPWYASEDTALISGYRAGQGVKDLARIHGRSTKAIELRLERLGVLHASMMSRGEGVDVLEPVACGV